MRKKLFFWCMVCFGLFFLIGVVSISNVFLSYRIERVTGHAFGNYYQYSGVVHIHTTYSDGGGTYKEIGHIAESLGLDFIIPSDHNTVLPILDGYAGYSGKTLVLPGVEISTTHSHGHFLVIGDSIPIVPGTPRLPPGLTVGQVAISSDSVFHKAVRDGSMTFLAHVFHPNERLDWDNWNIGRFTGIELYNLDSDWRKNLSPFRINRLLSAFVAYPLCDAALNHLISFPEREMEKYDELNMTRKVVGIGSIDAHSRIRIIRANRQKGTPELSWHFPSYECMFELLHTIIVIREPFNGSYEHDRALLLHAIRNGNMYVGFSGLENARGFLFTASRSPGLTGRSDSTEATMGESMPIATGQGGATLSIVLPDSSNVTVQLVRNGSVIGVFQNIGSVELPVTEPGVYRVQVFQHRTMLPFLRKRAFPWIISNPIYLYE